MDHAFLSRESRVTEGYNWVARGLSIAHPSCLVYQNAIGLNETGRARYGAKRRGPKNRKCETIDEEGNEKYMEAQRKHFEEVNFLLKFMRKSDFQGGCF